jgi:hypothetical protein
MSVPTVTQLLQVLERGEVSPQCDCCPCSNIYVFASVETAITLIEALNWNSNQNDCTTRSYTTSCCTENCLDKIEELYSVDVTNMILDKGVYEYSLLGKRSTLCDIYDYLKENNVPEGDAVTFIETVLDNGIVFQCYEDNQLLSNVNTYLQWAEARDIINCTNPNPCNCLPPEQCCLSVIGSVSTYLLYNTAITPEP